MTESVLMAKIRLQTDDPIALDSKDRLCPLGALHDDTHSLPFLAACERLSPGYALLDIGCAGGGIVADAINSGHFAVGLDGAEAAARSNWKAHPSNFFHCDVRQPFQLYVDEQPAKFNVISAWEFLEHIEKAYLPTIFDNVQKHLAEDGIFVCSVSSIPCVVYGISYHVTVEDQTWWDEQFTKANFDIIESPFEHKEYARVDDGGFRRVIKMRK